MPKLKLKVVHPTNGSDVMIEADSSVTVGEVIFELVQSNFLTGSLAYSVAMGKDPDAAKVADHNKSMKALGLTDGATLAVRVAESTAAQPPAPPQKQANPQKKKSAPKPDGGALAASGEAQAPAPARDADATARILEDYARVLAENAQWTKRHELEYKSYVDERTKLENALKSHERKLGETKIAAVVLAGAQIVTGLGAAFVAVSALPSILTIAAGVLMTAGGLWLSFRKSR